MNYLPGHIKRNPDTSETALRTGFPEDKLPNLAWLVATLNLGARNARTEEVEGWVDVHVPADNAVVVGS